MEIYEEFVLVNMMILWLLYHGFYDDYLLVISMDLLYTLVMACSLIDMYLVG